MLICRHSLRYHLTIGSPPPAPYRVFTLSPASVAERSLHIFTIRRGINPYIVFLKSCDDRLPATIRGVSGFFVSLIENLSAVCYAMTSCCRLRHFWANRFIGKYSIFVLTLLMLICAKPSDIHFPVAKLAVIIHARQGQGKSASENLPPLESIFRQTLVGWRAGSTDWLTALTAT